MGSILVGTLLGVFWLLITPLAGEASGSKLYCTDECKETEEQHVHVDSVRGIDCSDCSKVDFPCKSIEYALRQRDLKYSAFNIFVLSSNLQLTAMVEITSIPDRRLKVSLIGTANMSYLQCNSTNRSDTGLYFRGLNAVTIRNVIFENCGWKNINITSCNHYYIMAVGVMESANINITNVIIRNSHGVGLALFNTTGDIHISHSIFRENAVRNDLLFSGGGGLLIHANFRSCQPYARYKVWNCSFIQNNVSACDVDGLYYQGGGMNILFDESSCFNHVTVADSIFSFNQATWGGGFYTHFTGNVSNNFVEIKRCGFDNNKANMSGGGSNTGYYSSTSLPPPTNKNNRLFFEDVNFTRNFASYGGGSAIFASHGESFPNENGTIIFNNCAWAKNTAYFSSAVDIAPYVWDTLKGGYIPTPMFNNCKFHENSNIDRINGITGYLNIGVFMATSFTVHFNHSVSFIKNSRSALCLVSGVAIFHDGMSAAFFENSGTQGGAISMYGASMLIVNNRSVLEFTNNTALYGGAIAYDSTDQHDYVSSRSCFIQFQNDASTIAPMGYQMPNNVTFIFRGNYASVYGKAIYATSLWPCFYACHAMLGIQWINESFRCVGNFSLGSDDIRTKPETFGNLNELTPIYVVPGMPRNINVKLYDETNVTIQTIYYLDLKNNPDITVCNSTRYTNVPMVCVEGQLSTTASISIVTIGERVLAMNLSIATTSCPPGYVFNDNNETQCGSARICVCSALCKGYTYVGIDACNTSSFQAFISLSTWVGYYAPNGSVADEDNLYTAPCVSHLCVNQQGKASVPLPSNASNALIEAIVCAGNRQGVLCASCTSNNSAYYHSLDFTCGANDPAHCRYGGLYYLLSEILPLTVMFSVAMAFDVSFTSGNINGFVLFCQIFNAFDLTAGGRVIIPKGASVLNDMARIIYGFFNLDFFSHSDLAFCIWEGATILDVLSFKYVTTIYAFGLIMLLILAMNYCSCVTRIRKIYGIRQVSFIHGLSAFLIVCYGQCAQVTCAILLPVVLKGKNGGFGPCMSKYGGVLYFHKEHLRYAIPACAAAMVLLLPPIILILNPSFNKVLRCFSCSESLHMRSVTLLCSKPKPFLDSFQGCFKDDLRFFAGLYFVYRLLPASVYMFVTTALQGYVLIESFLVSFLLLHAVFQPYITRAHNILDGLLFSILVAINSFTLFNYSNFDVQAEQTSVAVLCWSQVFLSYIPLCYIIWYITQPIVNKCRHQTTYMSVSESDEDLSIITSDRLNETSQTNHANYLTV